MRARTGGPLLLAPTFLRIANNATWYVSKKQIHDDSKVPILADVRKRRPGLQPKLGDAANPLFQKL
jgi:hypothetical protein